MITQVVILLLALAASYTRAAPECDWSGSGLSPSVDRGVTPVYLRCREGRVSWSYPQGALRVLLQLPSSSSQNFRACLRPHPSFQGASIYLEGPRSLAKLYSPADASKSLVRCFQSRGGQAALYVEATEQSASAAEKKVATFSYDLQPIPKGKSYDPSEECRPCTNEEMTHAFCTSELVVRGIIKSVIPVDETDVSEIKLRVSKTLMEVESWVDNDLEPAVEEEEGTVTVQMPRHCGAQHGGGEVVIMARRKLGQLVLRCAPRAEEWSRVVKRLGDSAHCLLSS